MKMSTNENETVDIRLYASVRSNSIDFEERNRMERPSRVFSSHHHITMPPVLTDNNMEQNEHTNITNFQDIFSSLRSRYPSHSNILNTSSTRTGGNTSNIDVARFRFRSNFPQTTPGQSPLSTVPLFTNQSSTLTTNTADINTESDDEPSGGNLRRFNVIRTRHFADNFNGLLVNGPIPRLSRSGRRSRRYTEMPYVLRNNSNNSASNGRINRRVRFSATPQYNDSSLDRSPTPEQELPEVLVEDMVTSNLAEDQESISSVSSNDVDSEDERVHLRTVEEDINILEGSNDVPRTRAVPMSPIHSSPPTDSLQDTSIDSPSYTPDSPITNANNNNLPDIPAVIPLVNNDNNQSTSSIQDLGEPASLPLTPIRNLGTRNSNETILIHDEDHPRTYEELNDQLMRLFECPVCFEHINPPVYQCIVGHLICGRCAHMCENCPTCRNPFYSKRNLYMEKVCNFVKFPCKNALTGCKLQFFAGQKEVHEQECNFQHYQCFFNNCIWKGYLPEMHIHMNNNHHCFILHGSVQVINIMFSNNNQSLFWFLSVHNEFFAIIVQMFNSPRRVKIQVNYVGPAAKAKKFKFKVLLSQQRHQSDMNQKLVYERLTLPYSEIHETSNNINGPKKDIFCMPMDVLMPFTRKGRSLPFTLKVEPNS